MYDSMLLNAMRLSLPFLMSALAVAEAVIPAPRGVSGGNEGYTLYREGGMWRVEAEAAAGYFYAEQTRQQLERAGSLPDSLTVADSPRYAWRGLHLDVSRHFFTLPVLRQFIDRMAQLKLNRLHLHLTDGPGWRFEVKAFPRLTKVGAWRRDKTDASWNWRATELGRQHERVYGGFYTQEELRELAAYAADRQVMLVPEVDFPGHSYAALFCYPELALPGFEPYGNGLRGCDVLNVRSPQVRRFVETVLDELMEIFPPGTPIHLGGDEVPTELLTAEEQRAFMQHCVDYLLARGRQAITWDEAAEMGVRGQFVMLWRAEKLESLLQTGLSLILCPNRPFYFDYPRFEGDTPTTGEHVNALEDVFAYEVPAGNIIGLQGNLWTEHIRTAEELFTKAYPRAAALVERAWGSPRRPLAEFLREWKTLRQAASGH